MYHQSYDPLGNVLLSTVVATIPIVVLLYFIAAHRHRDPQGILHYGIPAPWAAFFGVVAAFLVSCLAFGMPVYSAVSAFTLGVLSGFLGIIWIVLAAMLLYTMTVVSGKFQIVKESIIHISFDRRLQCVLIAFCFGAIIEGTSGFGTPVAIAGAVMVGLGFRPFQSAVLNLLANTAPVAWGAIGTPIVTLAAVSELDQVTLSHMVGRQLPLVSVLVPFWLVATFVKMEGGTWKEAFEVWPAALCAGVTFAVMQFLASGSAEFHLLTDVVSGVFSLVCTALFLNFIWHPKTRFLLKAERAALADAQSKSGAPAAANEEWKYGYSLRETVGAWLPWVILIACCGLWGTPAFKQYLNNIFSDVAFATTLFGSKLAGTLSLPVWEMPSLHNLVQRMPPVVPLDAKPEAARFVFNWLSAAGTGVFVAALLSGLALRLKPAQWREATVQTLRRMKTPVIVIALVLGLSFLTRYAGTDAVLGLAFTNFGYLYPFFAAYLGWLGVFLTGSDTASNALFGNLQKITAHQLNLNEVLMVATNSSGGVMGKMIDAQSIMVACAACYSDPRERTYAIGPIFRTVFWHSIAGASLIGIIAMLQAYAFPWMIPALPAAQ